MSSPSPRSRGELQITSGVIAGGARSGVTSGDAVSVLHRGSDEWTGIPPTWDQGPNATLVVSVIREAQRRERFQTQTRALQPQLLYLPPKGLHRHQLLL